MRDTLFTDKMKKREMLTFLVCFIAAYILHVIGIILSESPAIEMITRLHVALIMAVVFYLAILILRAIYYALTQFWLRNRK
jgi:hypothetical protein